MFTNCDVRMDDLDPSVPGRPIRSPVIVEGLRVVIPGIQVGIPAGLIHSLVILELLIIHL